MLLLCAAAHVSSRFPLLLRIYESAFGQMVRLLGWRIRQSLSLYRKTQKMAVPGWEPNFDRMIVIRDCCSGVDSSNLHSGIMRYKIIE